MSNRGRILEWPVPSHALPVRDSLASGGTVRCPATAEASRSLGDAIVSVVPEPGPLCRCGHPQLEHRFTLFDCRCEHKPTQEEWMDPRCTCRDFEEAVR
jgi:hypothetical protein